jgi:hypothetical protein
VQSAKFEYFHLRVFPGSENSRVNIFVWCRIMIEFRSNVKEIYCLLNTWTGVAWKVGTTLIVLQCIVEVMACPSGTLYMIFRSTVTFTNLFLNRRIYISSIIH